MGYKHKDWHRYFGSDSSDEQSKEEQALQNAIEDAEDDLEYWQQAKNLYAEHHERLNVTNSWASCSLSDK